ncbi:MAG: radical SAM protein [Desulfobacterales bacterium]|nr:radical SAM protein [Desulfobacterales bacterium]
MFSSLFRDAGKKNLITLSFLRKKLIHCNLQLLYQCNFKCKICNFWKEPYKNSPRLSVQQVRIISEKLKQIGPLVISIGGGEPLLHDELTEIAGILSKNNFTVMISNGWFMTPEKAHSLFSTGMYEISISLDYADPAKHDELRRKNGAFDRALNALKMLHENRVYPYQRVNMITTVFEDNLEDIEPLICLCRDIGITYLVSCYSPARGDIQQGADPGKFSARLMELKKKYRHFVAMRGYLSRFSEAVSNNGISPCYAGKNLFNIDSQGDVTLCIDRLDDPAGNILTDDTELIEKKLLEQHRTNKCIGCWTSCRGPTETLLYGKQRLSNWFDYYRMTKDIGLGRSF